MKSKFKKGQMVICRIPHYLPYITVNKVYKIIAVDEDIPYFWIRTDTGGLRILSDDHMESLGNLSELENIIYGYDEQIKLLSFRSRCFSALSRGLKLLRKFGQRRSA